MKMLLKLKTEGGATVGSIDLAKSRSRFVFSKAGFHNIDTITIQPKRKGRVTRATLAGREIAGFGIGEPNVTPNVPVVFKPGDMTFGLEPS